MHPRRRNRELFTWLVRRVCGTSHPCRGDVDAATGDVRFLQNYRPIRPEATINAVTHAPKFHTKGVQR